VITAIDKETITKEIIPLVTGFLAERGYSDNSRVTPHRVGLKSA
jgi:hypothetical protein